MKEALYYKTLNGKIVCELCPHLCTIKNGNYGICGVRKNIEETLFSENFSLLSAVNFDPIEKKPLYHFYPGSEILSIGSIGCNMTCKFCQNWQISQKTAFDIDHVSSYTSEEITRMAKIRRNNIGVAYTYNEPTVGFEFMLETATLVKASAMKNVMVSNGFINEQPLNELINYIDAFNIDLKAFNDVFYKQQTGARIEQVKKALKLIAQKGRHLEITCLIIPTLNDNEKEFTEMINWISGELGKKTVLHLSRYHPMYKLDIHSTESSTLENLYSIASSKLDYVYVGNINLKDCQDTVCPNCGKKVVSRSGYFINIEGMNENGSCANCGLQIMMN